MKISWGTAIAIFYSLFAAVMVGMVVLSKSFDHALVVENYYEQDLNYQAHLDKIANSRSLASDLAISEDEEKKTVRFQFPQGFRQVSGEAVFYKPDDQSKDFTVSLQPDERGGQVVPTGSLATGRWRVKVEWQGDGRAFFKEETIEL